MQLLIIVSYTIVKDLISWLNLFMSVRNLSARDGDGESWKISPRKEGTLSKKKLMQEIIFYVFYVSVHLMTYNNGSKLYFHPSLMYRRSTEICSSNSCLFQRIHK